MEFGIPREVRDLERRVGLTPSGVLALTREGHTVYVEKDAGVGAGFSDADYEAAGARIVYTAAEVYGRADVVAKVARPTAAEHALFRPGQTIFSFFHLPVASPDLLEALVAQRVTAVAYEMIEEADGMRPVLQPASIVAGRMAPLIAGHYLRSDQGVPGRHGRGILLSGIPGVPAAAVVIVGGGVLGTNAARAFVGMGAEVTVLDKDPRRLQKIDEQFNGRITTMFSNQYNLRRAVQFADVLVGAVLIPGQRAPILITREMVQQMRPGSVIIDFAIDEGGCVETSRPTTLRDPVYVEENIIHFCVPNLTAAVARTTSYAINNGALPYLHAVARHGWPQALQHQPALLPGINVYQGKLAHPGLAAALGRNAEIDLTKILNEGTVT
ncbi:MAG: alanine dehydrogenase [Chloroflexi bacterium]|nr:MAG: alanine dehydrogenase [Chloroflexota bacterium]